MNDLVGGYAKRAYRSGKTLGKLLEPNIEAPSGARRAREEDLHRLGYASAEPGRTGHQEITRTTGKLPIENEERKSTEMVAVEMADEDCIDLVGVDTRSLERDERRGTEVYDARITIRFREDARLEATAAAEGVAASKESNSDSCHGLQPEWSAGAKAQWLPMARHPD